MDPGTRLRDGVMICRWGLAGFIALMIGAGPAKSQTDYYNLDKHRPLRVEDAYATERFAFELQVSPLTLAGGSGVLHYAPSVELKHGLWPGMELSAGLDADIRRRDGRTRGSFGSLELSTLYNLNTETLGMPALGLRLTGHVPLAADEGASLEIKGMVTRVLGGSWRGHVNGGALLGDGAAERWWGGLALDYVLPFRSLLVLGESYYARPRLEDADGRVHTSVGFRYQLTPWTGMDVGVGRDWTGGGAMDWRATFGVTTAMAFRSLMRLR